MAKKNYYDILGISERATEEEIKAAYRKLARKYHPDVSKEDNAEEKFKELGKAYETLKDPAKKKQYDEMLKYNFGEDKFQQENYNNQFSEQNPFSYFYSEAPSEEYSDIFEHIFNRDQPKDVHAMLEISIEEAFHGCEKIVNLTLDNKQIKQLKIKIPPGLLNKSHIRLKEQGGLSKNNKPRDLYVEINIKKHPFFNLQAQNIFLSVPVLPWEAVLGKAISVPTLYGPVQVKLPKNLKNGQKLRLKGKGFPGKTPGDQFITAMIENPENLDQKIISLYQELDSYCKTNPRKKLFGDL